MTKPFFSAWRWGMCAHAFGFRVYISNDKPVLFSERYGYTKVYRLGRWAVEARWLK